MDEFKFVLKCFIFACALVAFSQVKTEGVTIEAQIQDRLVSAPVAHFLNEAAMGGVKFIRHATEKTTSTFTNWWNSVKAEPVNQVIRNPSAKKSYDNSDLRVNNNSDSRRNEEVSVEADFDESYIE